MSSRRESSSSWMSSAANDLNQLPSEEELVAYLEDHNVEGLLNDLVLKILRSRPENVVRFIIDELQALERCFGVRATPSSPQSRPVRASTPSVPSSTSLSSSKESSPVASPSRDDVSPLPSSLPSASDTVEEEYGTPSWLPYSPIEITDDSSMAALGRRYSEARIRRSGVSAEVESSGNELFIPPIFAKSPENLSVLAKSLAKNVLFSHLDDAQMTMLMNAMFEIECSADTVIIRQGEEGDNFYVIESGIVDVFKEEDGSSRHVLQIGPGGTFGELALMYGQPRQATVKATTDCKLWAIDRKTYRHILLDTMSQKRKMYESFLARVPLLADLSGYERARIADSLRERVFTEDSVIVRQGEPGDSFFIILEGRTSVSIEKDGNDVPIAELGPSDYFGELALLNNTPRAATVRALDSQCRLVSLDRSSFTRLLGPYEEIMKRRRYETVEERLAVLARTPISLIDVEDKAEAFSPSEEVQSDIEENTTDLNSNEALENDVIDE